MSRVGICPHCSGDRFVVRVQKLASGEVVSGASRAIGGERHYYLVREDIKVVVSSCACTVAMSPPAVFPTIRATALEREQAHYGERAFVGDESL
jgi:hypothetical protein